MIGLLKQSANVCEAALGLRRDYVVSDREMPVTAVFYLNDCTLEHRWGKAVLLGDTNSDHSVLSGLSCGEQVFAELLLEHP